MPGPYGYDVTVKLAGLVCDMPRESAASIARRRERQAEFSVARYLKPSPWGGFTNQWKDDWEAEWRVFVEAWNADRAREKAMLRIQEDSAYTPGMFEQAASVHFDVMRHM